MEYTRTGLARCCRVFLCVTTVVCILAVVAGEVLADGNPKWLTAVGLIAGFLVPFALLAGCAARDIYERPGPTPSWSDVLLGPLGLLAMIAFCHIAGMWRQVAAGIGIALLCVPAWLGQILGKVERQRRT